MPTDAASDIERVHAAVLERGGTLRGEEWGFRCPCPQAHAHGDEDPSPDWNPTKRVWTCRVCGAGGGYVDLAARFGVSPWQNAAPPELQAFASRARPLVDGRH